MPFKCVLYNERACVQCVPSASGQLEADCQPVFNQEICQRTRQVFKWEGIAVVKRTVLALEVLV